MERKSEITNKITKDYYSYNLKIGRHSILCIERKKSYTANSKLDKKLLSGNKIKTKKTKKKFFW